MMMAMSFTFSLFGTSWALWNSGVKFSAFSRSVGENPIVC